MSRIKAEKSSSFNEINKKWIKEEKRIFTTYPGLLKIHSFGGEDMWLELAQFYRDDLKWLLSLDHYKFWSHMIFSEKAHELLVSFLKDCPPVYLRKTLPFHEDTENVFKDIEHLVFLIFLRLSTEKELENCHIRNHGQIIYNNYLFTVPIILDICSVYGVNNSELVKNMINNVITSAPDFLEDFQEIIPHFIQVLKNTKDSSSFKQLLESEQEMSFSSKEVNEVLYLYDAVSTIQIFFELYPYVCRLFSKIDLITEAVYFYCNGLPKMQNDLNKRSNSLTKSFNLSDLIQNIRIDLLKIVKTIFDFVLNEKNEVIERKEVVVDEYLTLMLELLHEPVFFYDYNILYSVEFEVECVIRDCSNIDTVKLNKILDAVALTSGGVNYVKVNKKCRGPSDNTVKLTSLVSEVKDIFPHMEEKFIEQILKYYNYETEKVITGILENSIPTDLICNEEKSASLKNVIEFREKHKNLEEMLNDKEEILMNRERYAQFSFVADDLYDDEYDDTYDENIKVEDVKEEDMKRRPFVVPRVLRTKEQMEEEEEETEEEEEEEEDESKMSFGEGIDCFIENPPALSERRLLQSGLQRTKRNVLGSGVRGQGQNKEVLKNRGFKEAHKSFVANHNRKKQANRKMTRGMIPI